MTTKFSEERYDRMVYRKCGKWGLKLPVISLGAWETFGGYRQQEEVVRDCLYRAFDLGITHFDLANNYGRPPGNAEVIIGRLIKRMPRDELIIATKAGYRMWPGPYGEWGSRKYLIASIDQSLKRLGLDYVDIFYSHRPDPATPLQETLGALDQIVRQGKALYAGVSSYSGAYLTSACEVAEKHDYAPIMVLQPVYNLLSRGIETDALNVTRQKGIGVVTFGPLSQGMLTSKYLGGIPPESRAAIMWTQAQRDMINSSFLRRMRLLDELARLRGQTLAQMSIAWVLRSPDITSTIIGASRVEQIEENVAALNNPNFSPEELKRIDEILCSE
jgi:L-glyceraldehyde 3-phosphate reductase